MLENTGEAAAAGYTEENVSWRNPGRVSSSVRTAPPGSSAASSTVTARPARARAMAAASPFGPLPITTACSITVQAIRSASWCSIESRSTRSGLSSPETTWPQNACCASRPATA